jgi:hypothetical protein
MSPQEVLATVANEFVFNMAAKVFLIYRLSTVENRVLQAQVNCGGQVGLRYVWVSTANYDIRFVQGFPQVLSESSVVGLSHPCYDPQGGSGSIVLTDADIVQRLINFTPNQGITAGTVQFRSAHLFENLNLSQQTFSPNVLTCATALPACLVLPSTLQTQIEIQSTSVPTTGPTQPERAVMPPTQNAAVKTYNYWTDARLPSGHVGKFAQGTSVRSIASLPTVAFKIPFPAECSNTSNRCLLIGNEVGGFPERIDQLGPVVQTSASGSFSESPYSPQSAVASIPPWVVNFG